MYSFYDEDDNTHQKDKNNNRCMCTNYDLINNKFDFTNNTDYRRCTNKTYNGTNFCKKHQNCNKFYKLLTNNSEKEYNDKSWHHPYIEGTHNCYSYFLDDQQDVLKNKCEKICKKNHTDCPKKLSKCGNFKPQPGDYNLLMTEGSLKNKKREYYCPNMEKNIMLDNPSIKKTSFYSKCPNNYYKGAMVVLPGKTFHFYRQDKGGYWSHKPGTMKITNLDADGNLIPVPHYANRDYSNKPNKINYTKFCGYYCIPSNDYATTHSS